MYEYISGKIEELNSQYVIIDAGGIGYFINISQQSYNEIEKSSQAKLFIHFIVREDAQILYGFATKAEREIFRLLLGVSGVGSATARNILSTYTCSDLGSIISTGNDGLLKNVKGLGSKTAQKIIVELKDKIIATDASPMLAENAVQNNALVQEASAALAMLGFAKGAAQKAVQTTLKENPKMSVEEIIKSALKKL